MLVMIEHFSKWMEPVALPNKFNEGATHSFFNQVLSCLRAPAEVLMDQGVEHKKGASEV